MIENTRIPTGPALALLRERYGIGVSRMTLTSWCATHGIGRKVGGRWFVDVSALIAFVERQAA